MNTSLERERDEEGPTNDMDGTFLQPNNPPLAATPLTADMPAPKKKKVDGVYVLLEDCLRGLLEKIK